MDKLRDATHAVEPTYATFARNGVTLSDHIEQRTASSGSANKTLRGILTWVAVIALSYLLFPSRWWHQKFGTRPGPNVENLCIQQHALRPSDYNEQYFKNLTDIYNTDEFTKRAAEWLGGAVRVPTEVFDTNGSIGEDDRWLVFGDFHAYLEKAFPHVHKTLKQEKINTYGLLYSWEGTDKGIKPILLMAHQDVVPVDGSTYPQWKQKPFSGVLDAEGWLWGRGSVDDKSGLIGILSSVETLLEQGFEPKRGVVLSFGFDEEASGGQGAKHISEYLLEKHGEDYFAFILDEGAGFKEMHGQTFALPGIGEKGYFDARIDVQSLGGHSSVPPPHTSIGYLARLLVHIEANPTEPHLTRVSPMYGTFQCIAAHGPNIPDLLRKDIVDSVHDDFALRRVEAAIFNKGPNVKETRALLSTTAAVDMISGGVKSNALPEKASAIVNNRISTDSSVKGLQERYILLLGPLAAKLNLSFTAFGEVANAGAGPFAGSVTVSDAFGSALESAPVSPTNSEAFKLLSGTIRSSYKDANGGADIIVSPGMMNGNTDTRFYWRLTSNIFRYNHLGAHDVYNGVHTVNEAIRIGGFVDNVKFFTGLILNADESAGL